VVIKDSHGFIWLGTEQGLIRYDGYKTIVYDRVQGVSNSLSSQKITSIIEDAHNKLWIGTFQGGLNMFDPETETFHNFLTDSITFGSHDINAMVMDKHGHLWIGYRNGGLDRFDPVTGRIVNYQHVPGDTKSIISTGVSTLFIDKDGNLWIGTWDNGLCLLENSELQKHFYAPLVFKDKSGYHEGSKINKLFTISQDKFGNLWLASFGGGIFAYHPGKDRYLHLQVAENELNEKTNFRTLCFSSNGSLITGSNNVFIVRNSDIEVINRCLSDDQPYQFEKIHARVFKLTSRLIMPNVYSIFEGENGLLWIGTDIGVYKLSPRKFNAYEIVPGKTSGNNITAGTYIADGKYIFSVWGDGIYISDGTQGDIRTSTFSKLVIHDYEFEDITTITSGSENEIWFTSVKDGIFRYNLKTKKIVNYANQVMVRGVSNINYCRSACKGPNNSIWFGTVAGLIVYWPDQDRFYYYTEDTNNPNSLSNEFINCLVFENDTIVWLGTFQGGLNRGIISNKEPGKIKFDHFTYDYKDPASISENNIASIFIAANGDLWIGTANNGLNYFNRKEENFIRYTKDHGFASNKILSILEDNDKILWMANPAGLIKFDPLKKSIVNYKVSLDRQIFYFNNNGCFKHDELMIFSTRENLVAFKPSAITSYKPPDKVKLTGFKISNQTIHPGEKYPKKIVLHKSIEYTGEITLSYQNNNFTFYFSLLDLYSPQSNQYMYQLEGYDKKWIPTYSGFPMAQYSNVPPGEYMFKVIGANKDGIWVNAPTGLVVNVLPPWYESNMAIVMYLFILLGMAYVVRKFTVDRVNFLNEIKVQKVLHEKDNEVNQTKLKFFTNISHEIRTPATLIIAPLESIYNKIPDIVLKEQIYNVLRNVRKLSDLLGQLMDFRKIESGAVQLKVSRNNIVKFLVEIVQDFRESCNQKNIDILLTSNKEEIWVWYDPGKMDKIIRNLLSNSYKFTSRNGRIEVKAYTRLIKLNKNEVPAEVDEQEVLVIKVIDNGKGIPEIEKDKIFDRFYQIEKFTSRNNPEGTGIGLSIVKEFIQMHHGEIHVDSIPNLETTFTIYLPLGNQHYTIDEVATNETNDSIISDDLFLDYPQNSVGSTAEVEIKADENLTSTIMIVEDNDELRRFLKESLKAQYNILEARDGIEGYEMAMAALPDLIISDIMMPGMDGLDMTQKLKNNIKTSHLPIILLTAKSAIEDRITGLKTGADSYIPKPFHPLHLEVRIQKLIALRKTLRTKFNKDLNINVEELGIGSVDAEFLKKLKKIIEENISDSDLSVEKIGEIIGMSRSNLFKKLKSLTDLSPSEFIRNVRLNKALHLMLKDRSLNIADIGYKVGFGSPSYFTHCFRKVYGASPREFIDNYRKVK